MTFTATIGLDNFYSQYEVKVGAYNIHGDGPNSTVTVIYSAEGSKIFTMKIYIEEFHLRTFSADVQIIFYIVHVIFNKLFQLRCTVLTHRYFDSKENNFP